ncbi:unnamed protein product [Phyllotreta striolata]|uniref:Protein kinase domain-containing protein n=1 Tax=Phyllotreta striolata TaxID=444603 RepID=A0A9N9TE61_PHYSR|nr:unnamed protein product [Phyllotreta striolata]
MISGAGYQERNTRNLTEKSIRHIKCDDVRVLFSIFEFKQEIGHGSFGLVVEAIEKSNSHHYAIKIVNKFTRKRASRFQMSLRLDEIYREIKILKAVNHPNIVILHRVYETSRKIYMVFELCHENLFDRFKTDNPFSDKVVRKITKQLVDAVYYLHKHDIVHRDIKMENILFTTNPDDPTDTYFIKLTDFGLSVKKLSTGIQGMLRDRVGTIIYMAPEILLECTYSELCDIWSVGVILYTMMYGKYPFTASNNKDLAAKIITHEPEFPTKLLDLNCVNLMKAALVKDPVSRITASEMMKNPWLSDNKMDRIWKKETVIDYMTLWKEEMLLPGQESDWVSDYSGVLTEGGSDIPIM